ncbi:replicative DNA helicase [Mycoplasma sp. 3341]|uniref:replicative DNA helicase n=1 Tax=Mycoplasma sp. 3341 TaxID=3447506 RepID=UPI003F659D68
MSFSESELNNILNNEISLLGILIRDYKVLSDINDSITDDIFYSKNNLLIYKALCEISTINEAYDIEVITTFLIKNKIYEKLNEFEDIKGEDYFNYVIENAGYKDLISQYILALTEFAKKRQLLLAMEKAQQNLQSPMEVSKVISELQLSLINIDLSENKAHYQSLSEVVQETTTILHQRQNNLESTGLKVGYRNLDALLLGFNPGDLVILAARPSMGKTAFALNIASNVAEQNKTVLFFSLEMTNQQLVERMVSMNSWVKLSNMKSGAVTEEDWIKIDATTEKFQNWHFYLNDKSALTLNDLIAICRRFSRVRQIDLIVIDYLQLITDSKTSSDNRQLEISKISRSLKQLAKELACPIISLSQLSRRVEMREDKKPVLSDLRESGSIEQDADSVLFLYRPDYYRLDKKANSLGDFNDTASTSKQSPLTFTLTVDSSSNLTFEASLTYVIVAKNRNGATGEAEILFFREANKFKDKDTQENNF